ncbi:TrkA domain protein [Stackebrandtia albiflava]|uniref:TrkA domain protein n=1 Tax=Stackebrandtia albiflava TaxID=406432 RepID=A0A562V2T9_9ACTN|nr:TrkA C-terminal domain-containing protein [Stackebrandtia albiflava]TWJ12209.1 TrkA domain protein [Stackebrandtia albiflava]
MRIERTALPGVGIRYVFTTATGRHVGVIGHLSGRRELVLYERDDPETVFDAVSLDREEARHVSDLLHHDVTEDHLTQLERDSDGVTFTRIPITAGSPSDGAVLDLRRIRSRTGAAVIAVVRDGEVITPPDREPLRIRVGDTVVAAGPVPGITALSRFLASGER